MVSKEKLEAVRLSVERRLGPTEVIDYNDGRVIFKVNGGWPSLQSMRITVSLEFISIFPDEEAGRIIAESIWKAAVKRDPSIADHCVGP